jgi:hypothetical protein
MAGNLLITDQVDHIQLNEGGVRASIPKPFYYAIDNNVIYIQYLQEKRSWGLRIIDYAIQQSIFVEGAPQASAADTYTAIQAIAGGSATSLAAIVALLTTTNALLTTINSQTLAIETATEKISSLPITAWSPTHGTVVYTSGTTATASAFKFTVDNNNCIVNQIWVYHSVANTWNYVVNGQNGALITAVNDLITVAGATPFLDANDIIYCFIAEIPTGDDIGNDVKKVQEQSAGWTHRGTDEHGATLTATNQYYYVIPGDTYRNGSITNEYVMGAGSSAVIKVYMTDDATENITTITIGNWFDVSSDIIGAASLAAGAAATTEAVWFLDTNMVAEYWLVEVDYTDAADSTVDIKAKKTF